MLPQDALFTITVQMEHFTAELEKTKKNLCSLAETIENNEIINNENA